MCGIVAYTGRTSATPFLLEGLRRLEYRGYDSAGIAVVSDERELVVHRAAGKLRNLVELLDGQQPGGHVGIGHTRWATHGPPTDQNAHPHADCTSRICVVHNGIIENYVSLRAELEARRTRASVTDRYRGAGASDRGRSHAGRKRRGRHIDDTVRAGGAAGARASPRHLRHRRSERG